MRTFLILSALTFILGTSNETGLHYYLYTKEIREGALLDSTTYDLINMDQPTKFLIHGYLSTVKSDWNKQMNDEYFKKGDFNVIHIDWSYYASNALYKELAQKIPFVGSLIADFIITIQQHHRLLLNNTHFIGSSLGAHICGYIAKRVDKQLRIKIPRITALDPSGPLFGGSDLEGLTKKDADVVDVIHTSVVGAKGTIGTVDFYPNGLYQPGCILGLLPNSFFNVFVSSFCSHKKSNYFFLNSINKARYVGVKCESWEDFQENHCNNSIVAVMGDDYMYAPEVRGKFYLYAN